MIIYVNIAPFMGWFLSQIYSIFGTMVTYLDNIQIATGVSILDFTIAIAIIGVFISIIITIPSKAKIGKEKRKNDK